ncbi:hypothetical protein JCM19275_3643 [Nonlabens ulvanivorans]|uniref:Uncharacterized protein n=1 Tax=Nonlabens ulvanivorans TaxID=906888 RepID=A0A090WJ71_NONUL|nr:hypothetical protein [Nonlabens ulvanivorans]GAL77031.1 hypothetical protein JCM19275_3643 [Nonlabens ulvanivorans]
MKKELLNELNSLVKQLPFKDMVQKEYLVLKLKMSIISIFGHDSFYLTELESINFLPSYDYYGAYDVAWNQGYDELLKLISVMTEQASIEENTNIKIKIFNRLFKKFKRSTLSWFFLEYLITKVFDYLIYLI